MIRVPDWLRSDYEWVWNGELVRFAIITLSGVAVVLAGEGLGRLEANDTWYVAPLAGGLLAIVDYIRGRLPAND